MCENQLHKLKKCSVKVRKMQFIGGNPEVIQDQVLDQRVRRCSVKLKRWTKEELMYAMKKQKSTIIINGHKTRRFCIRVQRLPLGYIEVPSPQTPENSPIFSNVEVTDLEPNANN